MLRLDPIERRMLLAGLLIAAWLAALLFGIALRGFVHLLLPAALGVLPWSSLRALLSHEGTDEETPPSPSDESPRRRQG